MQEAITRAQDRPVARPLMRSSTPLNAELSPILEPTQGSPEEGETSPYRQERLATESQVDQPLRHSTLKEELGIDNSVDGSPHRFYDWENDADGKKGAADPNSFLPIAEQIRLRAERLRRSQIEKKEQEVARRQRRREKR